MRSIPVRPCPFGNRAAAAIVGLAILVASGLTNASIIQISNRTALGANDFVDWGGFGPPGTGLSTPVFISSNDGLTVGAASSGGLMLREDEGAGWTGNFAPGDHLLTQSNVSDSFIVSFANPVEGFGIQIEPALGGFFTGGAFTVRADIFAPDDTLLGSIATAGNATMAEDNSAAFIGALSGTPDIGYVKFYVSVGRPLFDIEGDLAINRLDLLEVPEPASLLLVGGGLIALAVARQNRAEYQSRSIALRCRAGVRGAEGTLRREER